MYLWIWNYLCGHISSILEIIWYHGDLVESQIECIKHHLEWQRHMHQRTVK